jgi:hypothetical protein
MLKKSKMLLLTILIFVDFPNSFKFHRLRFTSLPLIYILRQIQILELHRLLWLALKHKCILNSILFYTIPLACAECDDSLPFSGASSIPPCHILFPATLLHQPFFHLPSLHLAIYFLVYLLVMLFPNSYTILFWEFYLFPLSVHVQTNVIYVALLSLLW